MWGWGPGNPALGLHLISMAMKGWGNEPRYYDIIGSAHFVLTQPFFNLLHGTVLRLFNKNISTTVGFIGNHCIIGE